MLPELRRRGFLDFSNLTLYLERMSRPSTRERALAHTHEKVLWGSQPPKSTLVVKERPIMRQRHMVLQKDLIASAAQYLYSFVSYFLPFVLNLYYEFDTIR